MTGRGRRVQKAHARLTGLLDHQQADDARERSSSWRIGPSRWPARAPMSGPPITDAELGVRCLICARRRALRAERIPVS